MEKLLKDVSASFEPSVLYLDDIEHIIEIFKEASDKVNISTADYAIEDLNQLSKLKYESLNELNISIDNPHLSLHLKPDYLMLFTSKNDLLSIGLFEKIKAFLLKKRRPFIWLINNFVLWSIFSFIGLYSFTGSLQNHYWIGATLSSILIIILGFWIWYYFRVQFKIHSVIILKNRIQAPSFWKRNSDKIWLIIMSALAGGIITFLIEKATRVIH
ncbi:MAG: hypothetical protein ABSG01_09440 [Anaerolineales bacterium]|jgi:hypothetical protein